ncbi:AEC family transporter [Bacillus suaedaesalsae]|uniref:AEC family transporter n=1 Tax=Bacillus suaedaesalsae TaxID=2810349 RepID=A0ABS2DF40_9BACI|nr:AEC family transporter [Bacillus suaedaesalsae]MBM6617080.1 AEC family transporter [Bacillus suaedaesalsae]
MDVFFLILKNIMLPIFIAVGLGIVVQKKMQLDLRTLSKLNTYFLLPAVCFTNLYERDLSFQLFIQILGFLLLLTTVLIILSTFISKLFKFETKLSASYKNSTVLTNAGNFGIPMSELVFKHDPIGIAIAIIISAYQNIVTFTYGMFTSVSSERVKRKMIKELLTQPIIYSIGLAVLLKALPIRIPQPIWEPIQNISDAFLAIALLTLGAQLANLSFKGISKALYISIVSRLILSPAVAFLLLSVLQIKGVTAEALFIASAYPTSRNSAILALEYNNHPEFAAQAVLLTTMVSCITVTLVVYISSYLF